MIWRIQINSPCNHYNESLYITRKLFALHSKQLEKLDFIMTSHKSHKLYSVCVLSNFSRVRLCVILWTVAHQAPLAMGFSRQEYWSRLPCPPAGDLPDPGIEPVSLTSPALADGFFAISATWEAPNTHHRISTAYCYELRYWCWEWLKAGGEGDNRGWDGWRASPT